MRYICHSNGCDLVFGSVKEKLASQYFKSMISKHVFDISLQTKMERDHNNPLHINAGQDNYLLIGEPEVNSLVFIVSIGSCEQRQG
jgi:hypothetical protein